MFSNYLKTTLRNLWKNKTYSFLNIFGLAIGIACAGLIFLWVESEVNYDSSFAKKDRLYRILENQTYEGKVRTFWATPGPLAEAMKAEIPGIADACRVRQEKAYLFSVGDKSMYEKGSFADPSFFSMFTLSFVEGDAANAFKQVYSVVITEKMAHHFFGNEKPFVGKTIRADNKQDYVVTGVIKDYPENATVQADWIAPFNIYFNNNSNRLSSWGANSIATYTELKPGADVATVNKQLYGFFQKRQKESSTRLFLFSMNDWRLRAQFEDGVQTGGRITYVRMFVVIAWIILLIACINFMNLATARSEKRAREVGVRKVLGAAKRMLVMQFLIEAVAMALLAVVVGIVIILMVLPAFNILVEQQLLPGLNKPLHIGVLLSIAILCGLLAGSYPALYLSSFNPVFVFKGLKLKSSGAAIIRKSLVVTQFSVSIILIVCTIVIYQQVQHVRNRELGYNKDNLITMDVRGDMVSRFAVIKQDLLATGMVENVALNSFNMVAIGNNSSGFTWSGKDADKDILVSHRRVSPEFIATAGIKIIEGRDFYPNAVVDSNSVIITESMAKLMGAGSAIGKIINADDVNMHVVGVVKNFVYGDMYGQSDPVIFFCQPKAAQLMYVRLKEDKKAADALAKIEAVMKRDNAAYPFWYAFVDEAFDNAFKSEMLIGKLSRVFAVLAIVISCLGLFGLAAYMAERRTKEVGIRKVLGASVTGITGLLSTNFLQLVLISMIIAFPVAWWAMHRWLQGYAYRISIQWWVFVVAGLGAMLIAMITVSFQAIKVALMNPVKSLRAE
ncbi:MAG: ABC transporter permease [Chitinophagaceae bacterium]